MPWNFLGAWHTLKTGITNWPWTLGAQIACQTKLALHVCLGSILKMYLIGDRRWHVGIAWPSAWNLLVSNSHLRQDLEPQVLTQGEFSSVCGHQTFLRGCALLNVDLIGVLTVYNTHLRSCWFIPIVVHRHLEPCPCWGSYHQTFSKSEVFVPEAY